MFVLLLPIQNSHRYDLSPGNHHSCDDDDRSLDLLQSLAKLDRSVVVLEVNHLASSLLQTASQIRESVFMNAT